MPVQRYSTRCLGGIDQSGESADLQTCADALNVWAPNGRVEKRPGYQGFGGIKTIANGNTALDGEVVIVENPIATFNTTIVLNSLPVGSRFYYGFTTNVDATDYVTGLLFSLTGTNSNSVGFFIEYFNGSDWVYIPGDQNGRSFLSLNGLVNFVWPNDLAQTTVNSATAYFFRFTLVAINGSTNFDASISASLTGSYRTPTDLLLYPLTYLFSVYTPVSGQLFVNIGDYNSAPGFAYGVITNRPGVLEAGNTTGTRETLGPSGDGSDFEAPVVTDQVFQQVMPAVIPETSEIFWSYGGKIHYLNALNSLDWRLQTSCIPQVETRDFAVGNNANYDADFVAQRLTFPDANFVLYHGSRLWMVDKSKVMWGAPYPYHKVLPLISEEPIGSDDDTDITGLASLGEHVVVFKKRSMYHMVFEGLSPFNLAVFRPIKVANIGCVSPASIKKIGNELIFYSEQGLMAFNGQRIRKVSLNKDGDDRLVNFFETLPPGKHNQVVAAEWKKQNLYLLALATDGSDVNNAVLVWDYEKDTFWIWDNIEAQTWIEPNANYNAAGLYFVDNGGRVFELGNGNTDHGATIEAYVKTQRFGALDNVEHKDALRVEIAGENLNRDVDIEVLADDTVTPLDQASGTATMSEDDVEIPYDTAVYDTDSYTEKRLVKQKFDVRVPGSHFQVKVTHDTKNGSFSLSKIALDALLVGD